MSDLSRMMHSSRPPTASGSPAVGTGSWSVHTPPAHLLAASWRSTLCGTPPSSNTATSPGAPGLPRATVSPSPPPSPAGSAPGAPGLPAGESSLPDAPLSGALGPAADAGEAAAASAAGSTPDPLPAQAESRTTNALAHSRRVGAPVMTTSSGRGAETTNGSPDPCTGQESPEPDPDTALTRAGATRVAAAAGRPEGA